MKGVDPAVVRTVGLWMGLTSAGLILLTLLVADALAGVVGVGAVGAVLQAGAVALWAVSGAVGSSSARADGRHGWPGIVAGAFLGGGLGYLALPGALGLLGLVLSREAGPAPVSRILLSAVLAGVAAAVAAGLSRRAPAAAPYAAGGESAGGRGYR